MLTRSVAAEPRDRETPLRLLAVWPGSLLRYGPAGQAVTLSGHARDQLRFRGATAAEVIDAIRTRPWGRAELGRMDCRMDLPFNAEWNGKRYSTKQVRPIFVEEADEIVVVTVYVYYF